MVKVVGYYTIFALLFLSTTVLQAGKHEPDPVAAMPPEFTRLTKLVGTWEGTTTEDEKSQPVTVTYELVSNGSAIMERLHPGTPKEMVSIYHRDGKSLAMTHYCAIGNRPYMQLKQTNKDSLVFEMQGTKGIDSAAEPHIHGLTLTTIGKDQLKHEWIFFDQGKQQGVTAFNLTRKK